MVDSQTFDCLVDYGLQELERNLVYPIPSYYLPQTLGRVGGGGPNVMYYYHYSVLLFPEPQWPSYSHLWTGSGLFPHGSFWDSFPLPATIRHAFLNVFVTGAKTTMNIRSQTGT